LVGPAPMVCCVEAKLRPICVDHRRGHRERTKNQCACAHSAADTSRRFQSLVVDPCIAEIAGDKATDCFTNTNPHVHDFKSPLESFTKMMVAFISRLLQHRGHPLVSHAGMRPYLATHSNSVYVHDEGTVIASPSFCSTAATPVQRPWP